jgi:hypothetical protein
MKILMEMKNSKKLKIIRQNKKRKINKNYMPGKGNVVYLIWQINWKKKLLV